MGYGVEVGWKTWLNFIHFNYGTHLFESKKRFGTWQFCANLAFFGGWERKEVTLWNGWKRWPLQGLWTNHECQATQRLKAPGNNATALDLCSFRSKIYALCADGSTQVGLFQMECMFVLEFPVKQPGPKMATETPYDSSPSKLGVPGGIFSSRRGFLGCGAFCCKMKASDLLQNIPLFLIGSHLPIDHFSDAKLSSSLNPNWDPILPLKRLPKIGSEGVFFGLLRFGENTTHSLATCPLMSRTHWACVVS